MDSDDLAAADFVPQERQKKRHSDPWHWIFKEIDMYGVTPQMVVGGHHKFKSWWGVCFSLLCVACISYYGYYKGIFFMDNQSSILIQKTTILDHNSMVGSKIQNLYENRVGLVLEFENKRQTKDKLWDKD